MIITYGFCSSPAGLCLIAIHKQTICHLSFAPYDKATAGAREALRHALVKQFSHTSVTLTENQSIITAFATQISWSAEHTQTHIPLILVGTPFQLRVWKALRDIPYGTTATYQHIAEIIGKPKAVRAVANAIARNNIAWLIPCHRVVRSSGALGGFRWGLACKQALLKCEEQHKVLSRHKTVNVH